MTIKTLLFCQHGWSDSHRTIERLGQRVAAPGDEVIAPELGYIATWLGMQKLVDSVDGEAAAWLARYPDANARVIGHSMGGLLWLEVLDRHPEWWPRFDRLVLLGAPVGGAELASLMLPLNLTLARDLSVDRRALGDRIAAAIPTASIVSDLLSGTDGLVTHRSARVEGARFIAVPGLTHMALRSSTVVERLIRAFFRSPTPSPIDTATLARELARLAGPGSPDTRLARLAPLALLFADGTSIRYLSTFPGAGQIFLLDPGGQCIFSCTAKSRAEAESLIADLRAAYADDLA
jgi:pimeloyl-ACP methyl ester carboxylesterase